MLVKAPGSQMDSKSEINVESDTEWSIASQSIYKFFEILRLVVIALTMPTGKPMYARMTTLQLGISRVLSVFWPQRRNPGRFAHGHACSRPWWRFRRHRLHCWLWSLLLSLSTHSSPAPHLFSLLFCCWGDHLSSWSFHSSLRNTLAPRDLWGCMLKGVFCVLMSSVTQFWGVLTAPRVRRKLIFGHSFLGHFFWCDFTWATFLFGDFFWVAFLLNHFLGLVSYFEIFGCTDVSSSRTFQSRPHGRVFWRLNPTPRIAKEPWYNKTPRDQVHYWNRFHIRFMESENFSICYRLTWESLPLVDRLLKFAALSLASRRFS